jgi:hypothetical protein
MKLDIVIAVNDRESVSLRDEPRERVEDDCVARGDRAQLDATMVHTVAETVRALFLARLGLDIPGAGQDGHSNEIDEVAGNDETPAASGRRSPTVMLQEIRQVLIDLFGTALAVDRQIVEIVPQVNIRKDEQALVENRGDHDYLNRAMTAISKQGSRSHECVISLAPCIEVRLRGLCRRGPRANAPSRLSRHLPR